MSIIPNRSDTTIIEGDSGVNLDNLEVNEVPYKAADGTLQGSGLMRLTSGSLLAPVGFAVESGSVDFGDVLRLSESAGFLAFENLVDKGKYQLLDYAVPRDAASSKPFYFKLIEPQKTTQATTGSNTITTNPLSFEYTTQLTARTNALSFNAKEKMLNVRIRITDKNSGVAVKYFPSKSSWLTGEYGTTFEVGDNVIDFQDTALILQADTPLVFDIQADSISLSGSNGIPAFSGLVQQGVFVGVADAGDIAALQTQINTVTTPFSGKYSDLTGVPATFSPLPHQHPTSDIAGLDTQLSTLTSGIQQANQSLSTLSTVATSGSYNDLLNKPALFSGAYAELTGKPVLFDGKYTSLIDKPTSFTPSAHTHVIGDVVGLQAALDSKLDHSTTIPVNASFSFKGLSDTDDIALANGYLVWDGGGTSISYSTTIPFTALSGKPTTLSGYGITDGVTSSSLSGTLASYVTTAAQTSVLTGYVTTTSLATGLATKANTSHIHVITDVTGLQSALDAKVAATTLPTLRRVNNTVVTNSKTKMYTAVSDATTSVWTVALGTDFTEIISVDVIAISTSNSVAGIRQASLNAWTATSTSLTGVTFGNSVIATVLLSAANTIALQPGTTVQVRVVGLGS